MMRLTKLAMAALALGLSACQTSAGQSGADQAATIDLSVADTRVALSAALAKALNRGRVELGVTASDLTSTVTVLPPPLGPHETHSTAIPIRFDIIRRKGKCLALRADDGSVHDLTGVQCEAKK